VLYLDSSALIKRYQNEQGTKALNARLRGEAKGLRSVFTSVLTYAEIHAAFARRAREKLLSAEEAAAVQDEFDADSVLGIVPIELGTGVLCLCGIWYEDSLYAVLIQFILLRPFGSVTWLDWV